MRIIHLATILAVSSVFSLEATAQKSKKVATPVESVEKVDINKVFKNWKPKRRTFKYEWSRYHH